MNITRNDLKPFQQQAAAALASMIQEYPSERFKRRFDPETGDLMPFLCRLRAITGAGKTPMLAVTAHLLKTGIVLWTTNRGAIISQTVANLSAGGKYSELLPNDTKVFSLGSMSDQDWAEAMEATTGLTILLATVASFNQEGDKLRIHQQRGDTTRWKMLGGHGSDGRKRPLYVFYDEGHGATDKQFQKLRELSPRAFLLASASPLPEDLLDLLSGKTEEERNKSLADRTVVVPTKEVVQAGLLKSRLYLIDCNTAQSDAVREAHAKWQELLAKMSPFSLTPIACFVVNGTPRGVDVWESLVNLGVEKTRIAVHLNGAEDVVVDRRGSSAGLIDTYKAKKSPEELRSDGYTHIIWNMSLREGWDEPLAYVGYFDDRGRSTTDRVQKIGRFVRQPAAKPFDDPDLNAAYFYFNVEDDEFSALIEQIEDEMATDGYEVIGVSSGNKATSSRISSVVRPQSVPGISPWFGSDIKKLDNILLDNVPLFHEDALKARGSIRTRVMDLITLTEDETKRSEEEREGTDVITPWEYITTRLAAIDSRIVDDTGTKFSSGLKDHKKMQQQMQFGSDAMVDLDKRISVIRDRLNDEFRLVSMGEYDLYDIKPFKLVSPDIIGVSDYLRERQKVRKYKHAVHEEYNGLNPFEVTVAEALDTLGLNWCRNPVRGYGIPIAELGAGTDWFYPDFLLWTDKSIWALDPKGKHLTQEAVTRKLLDMVDIEGLEIPIRVALILEGNYTINANGSPTENGKTGVTLIRKTNVGPKAINDHSVLKLLKELVAKP